jgi:hypothetical protein
MIGLPLFKPTMSADEARSLLDATGWREIGVGDWSWVHADPSDTLAARVTPFDPAYRMHAQAALDGPANRYLPRIEAVLPLKGSGHVVMMERLWPANEAAAARLCGALSIGNSSGYDAPRVTEGPDDTDLTALRVRMKDLIAAGAARFRLWGGSDIRPGNVMANAAGQLKLVDPVFIKGKAIIEAIATGDSDALSDFTHAELQDFLTIPPFQPGPETEALRTALARLYLN